MNIELKGSKLSLIDTRDCGFNGSLVKYEDNYLFFYRRGGLRMQPDGTFNMHQVELRFCILNERFQPASMPVNLSTGRFNMDPRVFSSAEGMWIISNNDNRVLIRKATVAIGEDKKSSFGLSDPALLKVSGFPLGKIEKNWMPFEYEKKIYFIRSTDPHIILKMNNYGECILAHDNDIDLNWSYGLISGGTPPVQINDNEFLTFFHSYTASHRDTFDEPRQYFIGAYIFQARPPFTITRISRGPLSWPGLLNTKSPSNPSRVLFPAGLLLDNEKLIMTYGENDNWNFVLEVALKTVLDEMTSLQDL